MPTIEELKGVLANLNERLIENAETLLSHPNFNIDEGYYDLEMRLESKDGGYIGNIQLADSQIYTDKKGDSYSFKLYEDDVEKIQHIRRMVDVAFGKAEPPKGGHKGLSRGMHKGYQDLVSKYSINHHTPQDDIELRIKKVTPKSDELRLMAAGYFMKRNNVEFCQDSKGRVISHSRDVPGSMVVYKQVRVI